MTPDLAAAITRSISCGAWPKEGHISVYLSDDGFTSPQQNGIFFIAGLIAKESDWPDFSSRWASEILESDPCIPYLYMTSIRSPKWRSKHGITKEQAGKKVRLALKIITESQFAEPYIATTTFSAYVQGLINDISNRKPAVERIVFNIYLSRKRYTDLHIKTEFHEQLIEYMQNENHKLSKLIGDVVLISMEDHMPLQAADILYWHLQCS